MSWFDTILLFSSYQDYYVPYESARIEYGSWSGDSKGMGKRLKKMVDNILNKIHASTTFVRIDCNYNLPESTFNKYIGQTAHLMILESFKMQTMFAYFFLKYFI